VNDAVLAAAKRLAAAGIDSARLDARLLYEHVQGDSAAFEAAITRRLSREPVAAITGHKEFWSLDFAVGPGVLIPRPDTETLIEQALALYPDRNAPLRMADLGTGSGAILVAAMREFPNATGIGFDISEEACRYATANAARLIGGRAKVVKAGFQWADGPWDLIFSNPPYIPSADIAGLQPEVRDHEPRMALDGGPDGLEAYRALAELLPFRLAPGGHALLEIGLGQAPAMELMFPGLELVRIAPDLSGIPRCVVLKAGNFLGNQGPIR
jgi:release factor glutamine methyltransferase